ncbi:MAG: hypothetical protein V2A78_01115 [bacterium]
MPRKKKESPVVIRHQVQQWEIECAQVALLGSEYEEAVRIFFDLIDQKFTLSTPKQKFGDRSLAVDEETKIIRLAVPYFQSLKRGDVLLLARVPEGIRVTPAAEEEVPVQRREPPRLCPPTDPGKALDSQALQEQNLAERILLLQEEVIRLQQEVARLRESEYKLKECRRTLKSLLETLDQ